MAPGFCTLRALVTWNTSTTPSVLQRSTVDIMAQNMPLRPTVSLDDNKNTITNAKNIKSNVAPAYIELTGSEPLLGCFQYSSELSSHSQ